MVKLNQLTNAGVLFENSQLTGQPFQDSFVRGVLLRALLRISPSKSNHFCRAPPNLFQVQGARGLRGSCSRFRV